MSWNNFNDADDQLPFALIPRGTLAKVRMTLRPGGFDDPQQGWTGGYATRNDETGSVYLSAEFVILEGPHTKQKVWSFIGLSSPKGPEWGNMGRSFVKGVLHSARGIHPEDQTDRACQARCIQSFAELDGIEFVAKVDVEKDSHGEDRNVIKTAITVDHPDYATLMGQAGQHTTSPATQSHTASTHNHAAQAPAHSTAHTTKNTSSQTTATGRPSWAQQGG